MTGLDINYSRFQSTPSARRATLTLASKSSWTIYFNPRPPRGGRPQIGQHLDETLFISIHALREEGDVQTMRG